MFSFSAIFKTPAPGLLQTIKTISAEAFVWVCLPGWEEEWVNLSIILAALLPEPEAKMAIFFTGQI